MIKQQPYFQENLRAEEDTPPDFPEYELIQTRNSKYRKRHVYGTVY